MVFIAYQRYWNGKGDNEDVKIIGVYLDREKALKETIKYLDRNEHVVSLLICGELYIEKNYSYELHEEDMDEYIEKTYPFFYKIKDVKERMKKITSEKEFVNEFSDEITDSMLEDFDKYKFWFEDHEYWRYDIEEKRIIV